MEPWLGAVVEGRARSLAGIGFSVGAIMLWMLVGIVLYRLLRDERPALALVGLAGYLTGVPLALVAFAFGATWGLADAASAADVALSTALMRGFLVMDDFATFLIAGMGNGCFAVAALRSGYFSRWLAVLGIIAATLVTVVLLRYVIPAFGLATLGYSLGLLWFILVGVVLIRKSRAGVAASVVHKSV